MALEDLKKEVIEVIRGTGAFGSLLLSDLIQSTEKKIIELENDILILSDTERTQRRQLNKFHELYEQLVSGNNSSLNSLTLEEQRNIINQLVTRVFIGRGYEFRIEYAFGDTYNVESIFPISGS